MSSSFDINNIATSLNNKADTDLTNVVGALSDSAKAYFGGFAMPSNKYDVLELGASASKYTAPANGWFYIQKKAGVADAYVSFYVWGKAITLSKHSPSVDSGCTVLLPVEKGDEVSVTYSATGNTNVFRFFYAAGSESEV